jgi:hypothetical protein
MNYRSQNISLLSQGCKPLFSGLGNDSNWNDIESVLRSGKTDSLKVPQLKTILKYLVSTFAVTASISGAKKDLVESLDFLLSRHLVSRQLCQRVTRDLGSQQPQITSLLPPRSTSLEEKNRSIQNIVMSPSYQQAPVKLKPPAQMPAFDSVSEWPEFRNGRDPFHKFVSFLHHISVTSNHQRLTDDRVIKIDHEYIDAFRRPTSPVQAHLRLFDIDKKAFVKFSPAEFSIALGLSIYVRMCVYICVLSLYVCAYDTRRYVCLQNLA